MGKEVTQPTLDEQRELMDVRTDSVDVVKIRDKKYKLHWLRGHTQEKLTQIMLKEGNDRHANAQMAAAIILNGYWKIKFFHWILWRWFYYIKQYGDHELIDILATAKKKIPVAEYYAVTTLATAMKDTMMMMTKAESERILHELSTGKGGK